MSQKNKLYVALTFDDGPTEYTEGIIQILDYYQIKGTFFMIGENAKKNPKMLQEVAECGHEIGNHTWNHPDITTLSPKMLEQEIRRTNEVIKEMTQVDVKVFRPPYGLTTTEKNSEIVALQLFPVLWDLDTADWKYSTPEPILERVERLLKKQCIILMHDGGGPREATVNVLPLVIEHLQGKGYEFLTVSEFYSKVYGLDL